MKRSIMAFALVLAAALLSGCGAVSPAEENQNQGTQEETHEAATAAIQPLSAASGEAATATDSQERTEVREIEKTEEALASPGMTPASYAGYSEDGKTAWTMSFALPEGWEVKTVSMADRASGSIPEGCSGIVFFRTGEEESFAALLKWPSRFGVCGTGLEQWEMLLQNGQTARIGYFDGHPDWDFVSFAEQHPDLAALNQGLTGADAEDALSILETLDYTETQVQE